MKKLRLYPDVKVAGQDFKNAKVHTLPNQSMTLAEIIKRFIRKEPLHVEHAGIYNERLGDLEKMKHKDLTEQGEMVASLKKGIADLKQREKDKSKKALESPPPAPAPSGAVTGSAGSGQAPAPS